MASLVCLLLSSLTFGLDFTKLEHKLITRFGPAGVGLLREWQTLLNSSAGLSEQKKLEKTNQFFNQKIEFSDDAIVWQQNDYWATPLETIGKGRGDCEDFAIAKYYTLIHMGIPERRLRLIYVKIQQGAVQQAHMVLAYYPTPTATPLVLDNINPEIKPASQRRDLTPVFSFNGEGVWHGTGNKAGNNQFSRWQRVQGRIRDEMQN